MHHRFRFLLTTATDHPLRFLLLFLRGGEQYVVQDEPVPRRVGIQIQVGSRIAHKMLVIFRVVATIKRPETFAQFAVNVAGLTCGLVFAHD